MRGRVISYVARIGIILCWGAALVATWLSVVEGGVIIIPGGDITYIEIKPLGVRGDANIVEVPLIFIAIPLFLVAAIGTRDWIRAARKHTGTGFPVVMPHEKSPTTDPTTQP
jgi:hypothetical protein